MLMSMSLMQVILHVQVVRRHLLLLQNPEWFEILVLAYPDCPGNWLLSDCSVVG